MTIVYHEDWEIKKGLKDSKRHQKKIQDAIRKGIRDVIGNEEIITDQGKKKVRVRVDGLEDYKFIHDTSGGAGGIGQGEGKSGDVIGRRQKQGGGGPQGKGKDEGSIGNMDVEIDVEELLDMMFEDLGLPWLDEKKKKSIEIPKGWKFETISKKGVFSRVHKKRTMQEAIKRNVLFIKEIMEQTGCEYEDAGKALQQAKGDIENAVNIIKEGKLNGNEKSGFLIHDDDLRYKQIEEDVQICSKAVVFALMDVSVSMTPDKKYLMKSLLFWLVMWLRKQYEFVEIRFIQHTGTAKEVDEHTFFYGGESGFTLSYTAFKKANYIIDTQYPLDEWNIYTVYCSDGEDFQPLDTLSHIKDMLAKKINMLSYVEIKPYHDLFDDSIPYQHSDSTLLPEIKKKWNFKETTLSNEGKFWINNELHFLLSEIRDKKHIWHCLRHMLDIKHPERKES